MSASVSWLTLAITCSCFPFLPNFANKSKARASRFSLELNSWSTKSSSSRIVRAKRCAVNSLGEIRFVAEHPNHGGLIQRKELCGYGAMGTPRAVTGHKCAALRWYVYRRQREQSEYD
jgi:hypothetical protein